ncbi:MAG: TldD/PmbA family protein [Candidatus Edwardsbacteria bacterium]
MKSFAKKVVNLIPKKKVEYADVRVVEEQSEGISVKNGNVEGVSSSTTLGFGVRVLVDGAWGFASSSKMEIKEAEKIVKQAIAIAKASALAKGEKVRLAEAKPIKDSWKSRYQKDPFAVSLDDKIALLLTADEIMRKYPEIKVARGILTAYRNHKVFASTEGSLIEQEVTECGGGISALAVKEGEVQIRSYPNIGGDWSVKGYEYIEQMKLVENANRTAEEAVKLLSAPICPSKITSIIIGSSQLALQVHESIGHPIELDRVFGTEASYAGTSFVTIEKLGNFRYGSPLVNVYADATVESGLGTFGYDDEGVPGQRVPIIKEGIFSGYLSSRETAPLIGLKSSGGAMRADGWNRIPLIRMTNINLQPGEWKLEDLIADTDDGVFFETTKTWSIDDKRLNFEFATEIAWEIKNGKLGQIFKDATYTGITPQFWNSCDAICNKNYWHLWGVPNCGKGQPGQTAHVGHGVAPARFRNVQVGLVKT